MKPSSDPRHHYNWWAGFNRLVYEPTPHSFWKLRKVLAYAEEFIDRWADWAETVKMQPAHLLRYDPNDLIGRGLAWRWTDYTDLLCFPGERLVITDTARSGFPKLFVYDLQADGRVLPVLGDRRREILNTPFQELESQPSIRQRTIEREVILAEAEAAALTERMGAVDVGG